MCHSCIEEVLNHIFQHEVLATAVEGLNKGNCPGMGRYKGVGRWGEYAVRYLRS